eukprot:CAMPEP_0170169176 /NCGR_PEP_ID=MMETSP0040_2-20121228/2116_1 /TAXON_ID=641309 /ORGANISM="Lotharella oceanica, Strain CCMP622" /LENGTH=120 /DNA_ID=CAMNT_0010407785 /DNA_START=566 /DNA_END=931 /DNA_ORIENTATION=+
MTVASPAPVRVTQFVWCTSSCLPSFTSVRGARRPPETIVTPWRCPIDSPSPSSSPALALRSVGVAEVAGAVVAEGDGCARRGDGEGGGGDGGGEDEALTTRCMASVRRRYLTPLPTASPS